MLEIYVLNLKDISFCTTVRDKKWPFMKKTSPVYEYKFIQGIERQISSAQQIQDYFRYSIWKAQKKDRFPLFDLFCPNCVPSQLLVHPQPLTAGVVWGAEKAMTV